MAKLNHLKKNEDPTVLNLDQSTVFCTEGDYKMKVKTGLRAGPAGGGGGGQTGEEGGP